tara:strand:- start:685 stop:1074 length:390 start_codon:yes stop_codon:yes gene_type:complete
MTNLSRQAILDLAEKSYFNSVDKNDIEGILDTMDETIVFSIPTHNVIKTGKNEVREMFDKLFNEHKEVWHGNFTHTIDEEEQNLASTFTVKNTEHDNSIVIKNNCNFFEIENGKFSSITVYMQGDNTLN